MNLDSFYCSSTFPERSFSTSLEYESPQPLSWSFDSPEPWSEASYETTSPSLQSNGLKSQKKKKLRSSLRVNVPLASSKIPTDSPRSKNRGRQETPISPYHSTDRDSVFSSSNSVTPIPFNLSYARSPSSIDSSEDFGELHNINAFDYNVPPLSPTLYQSPTPTLKYQRSQQIKYSRSNSIPLLTSTGSPVIKIPELRRYHTMPNLPEQSLDELCRKSIPSREGSPLPVTAMKCTKPIVAPTPIRCYFPVAIQMGSVDNGINTSTPSYVNYENKGHFEYPVSPLQPIPTSPYNFNGQPNVQCLTPTQKSTGKHFLLPSPAIQSSVSDSLLEYQRKLYADISQQRDAFSKESPRDRSDSSSTSGNTRQQKVHEVPRPFNIPTRGCPKLCFSSSISTSPSLPIKKSCLNDVTNKTVPFQNLTPTNYIHSRSGSIEITSTAKIESALQEKVCYYQAVQFLSPSITPQTPSEVPSYNKENKYHAIRYEAPLKKHYKDAVYPPPFDINNPSLYYSPEFVKKEREYQQQTSKAPIPKPILGTFTWPSNKPNINTAGCLYPSEEFGGGGSSGGYSGEATIAF
jgi:hypothetical protein